MEPLYGSCCRIGMQGTENWSTAKLGNLFEVYLICLVSAHSHQNRSTKNILHIRTEQSICLSSSTALNLLFLALSSPCTFSSFKTNKMLGFTWCFQLHMFLLNIGASWLGFLYYYFLSAPCVLHLFSALGKRGIRDVRT